jgi:hypothetical protein
MSEYISREEFLKRIKPYDTSDKKDKALYNFALSEMMGTPNANAISIPEGATNGDMIKAMFPDAKVNNTKYSYVVEVKLPYHSKYDTGLLFDKDWWNAPYKKEVEDE